MKKIIYLLLAFVACSANAQSLTGQWASLQALEEQPAYLILQFDEKDSVGIGLLLEMEQDGVKVEILVTCDGTFEQDDDELSMNFIASTLKGNCELDLPKELMSQLTDDINEQMNELKKQLVDEVKKEFVKILPMLKALEIVNLTDKELNVTTGNYEMSFSKVATENEK